MNEVKNPDAEIIASGVFIGFFIYTSVILIAYCFGTTSHKKTVTVSLMFILDIKLYVLERKHTGKYINYFMLYI